MSSSAAKNDWVSITGGSPEHSGAAPWFGPRQNHAPRIVMSHGLMPHGVSLAARRFLSSPGGFIEQ